MPALRPLQGSGGFCPRGERCSLGDLQPPAKRRSVAARLASSPRSARVYIDHKVLQSERSSGWEARYYYLHLLLPTKEIKRQMTGNEDFKNRHL